MTVQTVNEKVSQNEVFIRDCDLTEHSQDQNHDAVNRLPMLVDTTLYTTEGPSYSRNI